MKTRQFQRTLLCLVVALHSLGGLSRAGAQVLAAEKGKVPGKVYHFTKALFTLAGARYGREALYTDPLAWQLYNHTLKTPVEGAQWLVNEAGKPLSWEAITPDSLGRFRRRSTGARGGGSGGGFGGGMGGAYLYMDYVSEREENVLLNVEGDASLYFNGELHAGDPYASGWLYIPVHLRKGLNELYIRPSGLVKASLFFPDKPVQLNTEDPTLPVVLAGAEENASLQGAVVVINGSSRPLKGYRIKAAVNGMETVTPIPEVPAMSTRKVSFGLNASGIRAKGHFDGVITLLDKDKNIDEKNLTVDAAAAGEHYSVTFTSSIDGSLQYFGVAPQRSGAGAPGGASASAGKTGGSEDGAAVDVQDTPPPPGTVYAAGTNPNGSRPAHNAWQPQGSALFLSVHGAGVEAIGQARAYMPKDWGTLVAATNRRPRGFNWEDWGRIDALEVLSLAKARFHPDERYIYLTGHSMGGHGTWFLGATYPDKWAAIGACSGYPTLKDYGSHDGVVPDSATSPMEQVLLRASDQSDIIKLVANYRPLGVYVLHGDSDKVVPVKYARQMRELLGKFHSDMSYHEVPGAEHWYGNQSVDWKPMFDFFKWHSRPASSQVSRIDFLTSSPGISSSYYWASVQQQLHPLDYSRIKLERDISQHKIWGSTENTRMLRLGLEDFAAGTALQIVLDGQPAISYSVQGGQDSVFLLHDQDHWTVAAAPDLSRKGPHRYGTLKDAFNHRMVFVYGTIGTKEENAWSIGKARYDAETWYYRGNGAVDILSDKEYSLAGYADRGVILYGNATTNAAWKVLLADCPIRVERNSIRAGDHSWQGDSLGAYIVRPLPNSTIASVAVIGGTGLKGMEAANANQYFAGASGFPDYMIFGMDMLQSGTAGIKLAGFFDNDWKLTATDMAENK